MARGAGRCLLIALGLGVLSCAPAPTTSWRAPDATDFARLRVQLEQLRQARPTRPWVEGINVLLREPRSGRTIQGRGALAVAPGYAVRMILLGGAGSTMLDVWVSRQRWRVAVPALDVVRRGTQSPPDLPVGFLRWWFTEPLGGTLFAAENGEATQRWLLRTSDAVVDLAAVPCELAEGLVATRRASGSTERVRECRQGALASVGDVAEYEDLETGLRVRVRVESVSGAPPDEAAFVDPDAPGALAGAP